MIPKATEDTITGILKNELEKHFVKVQQFQSIATPSGLRKPDLLCQDGGLYPIEAKLTEANLVEAIAKVQNDYLKHFKLFSSQM